MSSGWKEVLEPFFLSCQFKRLSQPFCFSSVGDVSFPVMSTNWNVCIENVSIAENCTCYTNSKSMLNTDDDFVKASGLS